MYSDLQNHSNSKNQKVQCILSGVDERRKVWVVHALLILYQECSELSDYHYVLQFIYSTLLNSCIKCI